MEKLVRDHMPKICAEDPLRKPMKYRIAKGKELLRFMLDKLVEEATEARDAENTLELHKELADLLEVIRALKLNFNIKDEELERLREEKYLERGSFYAGIIWDGNK